MQKLLVSCLFALCSVVIGPVRAAEIDARLVDRRPLYPLQLEVEISGEIVKGDTDRLRALLSRYDRAELRDIKVHLESL